MALLVLFSLVLGVAVALVPWWGWAASLKLLATGTVLLLVNIYANPANPLVYFQQPEAASPPDAELEVAAAAYNRLIQKFMRQSAAVDLA